MSSAVALHSLGLVEIGVVEGVELYKRELVR